MNANVRIVALVALLLSFNLICTPQTNRQLGSTASAKDTDRVVFATTVIDKKGNFVTGLQRDNLQISIDKKPANIIDFADQNLPLSLGLIVDASGLLGEMSNKERRALISSVQQAMKAFMDASNPTNEYFLMAFNDKPQLLLDWTSDSKVMTDTLGILQPKGSTAFYDACYLAIDKVQHGRYSKHVLILISDGLDNVSTYSFDQVRDELRASDVLVYSVNFSTTGTSELGMDGQRILNEFSLISGGMSFYKSYLRSLAASDAVPAFEMIASELRHQYTITVTPNLASDNAKWHKINVKVLAAANAPDEMKHLSARTREGFYLNHR